MSIPVQRITLMIEHMNMLAAIRDDELSSKLQSALCHSCEYMDMIACM